MKSARKNIQSSLRLSRNDHEETFFQSFENRYRNLSSIGNYDKNSKILTGSQLIDSHLKRKKAKESPMKSRFFEYSNQFSISNSNDLSMRYFNKIMKTKV